VQKSTSPNTRLDCAASLPGLRGYGQLRKNPAVGSSSLLRRAERRPSATSEAETTVGEVFVSETSSSHICTGCDIAQRPLCALTPWPRLPVACTSFSCARSAFHASAA
jgi:hypothetical protein